jgi:hypothetical protein
MEDKICDSVNQLGMVAAVMPAIWAGYSCPYIAQGTITKESQA